MSLSAHGAVMLKSKENINTCIHTNPTSYNTIHVCTIAASNIKGTAGGVSYNIIFQKAQFHTSTVFGQFPQLNTKHS